MTQPENDVYIEVRPASPGLLTALDEAHEVLKRHVRELRVHVAGRAELPMAGSTGLYVSALALIDCYPETIEEWKALQDDPQ